MVTLTHGVTILKPAI